MGHNLRLTRSIIIWEGCGYMTIFPILPGQLVRISIDGTRQMIGICNTNDRELMTRDLVLVNYGLIGLNNLLAKASSDEIFIEGTDIEDVINDLCDTEKGVTPGEIDTDGIIDMTIDMEQQEPIEVLSTLATMEGKQVWINDDLELNYSARYYSYILDYPDFAPYSIGDGLDLLDSYPELDDFRNFKVKDDNTDYANNVFLIGAEREGVTVKSMAIMPSEHDDFMCIAGYKATAVYVHSDPNITEDVDDNVMDTGTDANGIVDDTAETPEIVEGDCVYNQTLDKLMYITTITTLSTVTARFSVSPSIAGQTGANVVWYTPRLNETAKSILAARAGLPGQIVTFDTNTTGLLPRQMMLIFEPRLSVIGYFMIQSVKIDDRGAGIFNFSITAEKRPQVLASLISHKEFSMYFNDL